MKMSLARLFFLVFVLVTTVSLSMPIHSSPEHPGNVDVRWTEPPKLEPELHPPDLVKRGIIGAVVDVIKTAIKLVQDQVNKEKDARSEWTKKLVGAMWKKDPSYNYIVCDTKSTFKPKGPAGSWYHTTRNFDRHGIMSLGGKMIYDIYAFHAGIFDRLGDGGWLNWAYTGEPKTIELGGHKMELVYT